MYALVAAFHQVCGSVSLFLMSKRAHFVKNINWRATLPYIIYAAIDDTPR